MSDFNLTVVWKHLRTTLNEYVDNCDWPGIKASLEFLNQTEETDINRRLLVDDKITVMAGYLESKYSRRAESAKSKRDTLFLTLKKKIKGDVSPDGRRITDWETQVVIDRNKAYRQLCRDAESSVELHGILRTLITSAVRRHSSLEQISNNERALLRKETD